MEFSERKEITYDDVAPSKLLNYVKKADLVSFITPNQYSHLEN